MRLIAFVIGWQKTKRQATRMRLLRQLEFAFERSTIAAAVAGVADPGAAINDRGYNRGRDLRLESKARELLRSLGAEKLAREVRVEWNPRLQTTAGSAAYP